MLVITFHNIYICLLTVSRKLFVIISIITILCHNIIIKPHSEALVSRQNKHGGRLLILKIEDSTHCPRLLTSKHEALTQCWVDVGSTL